MIPRIPLLLFSVVFLFLHVTAQPAFEIISMDGQAKVQRAQKRSWEKLAVGSKIYDNDMVETFFQTKMIMRFSEVNVVILGSNSKTLMNIVSKEISGTQLLDVSFTLFGGGIFVKALRNSHVSVYTANAVGEMDSGSVSAVAEAKTGETGFQVLGGLATVRNIAQQKGKELQSGLTTMILPGKEPTAPLYITYRHVAVLKHFFGEEYITSELDAAGIKPTDDRASTNRMLLSQGLGEGRSREDDMYKMLFSYEKIYGSILEDEEKKAHSYAPIGTPDWIFDENDASVGLSSAFSLTDNGVFSSVFLTPSIRFANLDASLRLSFAQDNEQSPVWGYDSKEGWLDKIDHLTLGFVPDSVYLYAGMLQDLTLGNGLMVNRYCNYDRRSLYHPLGLQGQFYRHLNINAKLFLSDISLPAVGGFHVAFEPGMYYLGAGYYYDFNQYMHFLPTGKARFTNIIQPDSSVPDPVTTPLNSHIYEIDFGADIIMTNEFTMRILFEFAQKLLNGNDGFVFRMPSFLMEWRRAALSGGFVVESGRLVSEQFNPTYHTYRTMIKRDTVNTSAPVDTILTVSNRLSTRRSGRGIFCTMKINPIKGTALEATIKHDYATVEALNILSDTTGDSTLEVLPDFSLDLRFSVDEGLMKLFKYASVYATQTHGRLFPGTGIYFGSWSFETGYRLITRPLLFNIAAETGGRFYFIDMDGDDFLSNSDRVIELYVGLQWGFL
jgi:hypothetical protein